MSAHGSWSAYSKGCRCLDCTTAAMKYRRRGIPPGDPRHGTTNGYGNLGCRCEPCCSANTAEVARQKAERRARGLLPGDPRHGTTNGYANWSCRCTECTEAATRDSRTTNLRRRSRVSS